MSKKDGSTVTFEAGGKSVEMNGQEFEQAARGKGPKFEEAAEVVGQIFAKQKKPDRAALDAQQMANLRKKHAELGRLAAEVSRTKSAADAAKKNYESKVADILSEIDPQYPLLEEKEPVTDEVWRAAPIKELDLSIVVEQKLLSAQIETLGQLADFTASGKALTEIMGETQAAKVEQGMDRFWQRYREATKDDESQSP